MVGMACAPPSIHHIYRTGDLVKKKITLSGAEPRQLLPHFDVGDFSQEPKNAQKPQDHGNDYDRIQDRLNGARHWNVIVDEPEKHTNYDQDQNHVD
jgi:hypothetical protein